MTSLFARLAKDKSGATVIEYGLVAWPLLSRLAVHHHLATRQRQADQVDRDFHAPELTASPFNTCLFHQAAHLLAARDAGARGRVTR